MKYKTIGFITILAMSFFLGCTDGGTDNNGTNNGNGAVVVDGVIQDTLDAQCDAMVNENVDALLANYDYTEEELTNEKLVSKDMFENSEITSCEQKITKTIQETDTTKTLTIETTMTLTIFGETQTNTQSTTRNFVIKDGKWVEVPEKEGEPPEGEPLQDIEELTEEELQNLEPTPEEQGFTE